MQITACAVLRRNTRTDPSATMHAMFHAQFSRLTSVLAASADAGARASITKTTTITG